MKFLSLAIASLMLGAVDAKKSKKDKDEGPTCPGVGAVGPAGKFKVYPMLDEKHYLVGLMTFEFQLDGYTTGHKVFDTPLTYIPDLGITDMEPCWTNIPVIDEKTKLQIDTLYAKKFGFYVLLVDEGYGNSADSVDFPLHYHQVEPKKPMVYNHGDTKFEIYTPFSPIATNFMADPDKLVSWKSEWDGHILDIQTQYAAPDDWTDLVAARVLTGRDFSPEGIANFREDCSVIGEKWGPSIFSLDTVTGHITSEIVQIPSVLLNLTHALLAEDYYLTTVSDKRHCYLHEVVADECGVVDNDRIDLNGYYTYQKDDKGKKEKVFVPKYHRIDPTAGWASLVYLGSGVNRIYGIFNQRVNFLIPTGPTEPGVRIYEIYPGDCTADCPPEVTAFVGWYVLSRGASRVQAMSALPGSSDRFLIHEHNAGFPTGKTFPRSTMPADKLCLVQIDRASAIHDNKICILNYMHISDPYDVDGNGSGVYAQSQKSNSALLVIDDYCVWGGTDPNLDFNDYDLDPDVDEIPFYVQAVESTRLFMVCYYEPIFDAGYPFLQFH